MTFSRRPEETILGRTRRQFIGKQALWEAEGVCSSLLRLTARIVGGRRQRRIADGAAASREKLYGG